MLRALQGQLLKQQRGTRCAPRVRRVNIKRNVFLNPVMYHAKIKRNAARGECGTRMRTQCVCVLRLPRRSFGFKPLLRHAYEGRCDM